MDPTSDSLSLQLAEVPDDSATIVERKALSPLNGYVEIRSRNRTRLVGYREMVDGATWRLGNGHLILDLPPLKQPLTFELSIGPVLSDSKSDYLKEHLLTGRAVPDLTRLLQPEPAQWEVQETTLVSGNEVGPFQVDELTIPFPNPWNSFLRFSGVDFLSDGRAVLTSLSGEIWIVAGLEGNSNKLMWTRFATGLNQPMGVKVVADRIYVTGRDQITLLHDRNGDGEADFYENFNNQVMAATNFHAFTLNLDTDSKGNFYFAKATPWPPMRNGVAAEITPHHGVLFRMPPDGSRLDIIATGLRNPNGLSIGPHDEILYSDNEGNWVPTSKVHLIKEGGFHGFMYSAHQDPPPTDFVKPILWVPHFVDNSPSSPIFINSPTWPAELRGQLLLTSYGRGSLSLVLKEEVNGQWQGAHLTLPLAFKSGLIHGRFHRDGNLYLAGLTSWQSVGHGGDWGSFHRVRYTGHPLHLPVAVNSRKGGLELRFTEPLDPKAANDQKNYKLSQWTYPWTSQYGTRGKIYSMDHPGETSADPVEIQSIQLSDDRKTVLLEIPQLRQDLVQKTLGVLTDLPDMIESSMGLVMAIEYRLRSIDGTEMRHRIHKTIHQVAGDNTTMQSTHSHNPIADSDQQKPSPKSYALPTIDDDTRVVDIRSTGVTLSYDVTQIRMKAGEHLFIRFLNASEMVHNLVVVKSEADINPVGIAAINAQEEDFIPQKVQDRILAASRLANPGDTVLVEFTAPGPGTYPYICTFSGHFTMMQGRIVVDL
jgi:glucose/arabinose dehydrogenase/plastocyanin